MTKNYLNTSVGNKIMAHLSPIEEASLHSTTFDSSNIDYIQLENCQKDEKKQNNVIVSSEKLVNDHRGWLVVIEV